MTRRKTLWLLFAGACALFIGYRLYLLYNLIHADHPRPPIVVSTAPVAQKTLPNFIKTVGTLKAVNAIQITSEAQGRVQKIHYKSDQDVQAGDPLIQLDDSVERAELQRYTADLTHAEANFKRATTLLTKGVESQAALDQKRAAYDSAKAHVAQIQAVLKRKNICAPFQGKVGIDHICIGQYLQPGTDIVSLTDISELNVNFSVSDKHASDIFIGQDITLGVDAFLGHTFEGKITNIEPQVASHSQSIAIQAHLNNSDKKLLPGMFAQIQIFLKDQPQSIVIPETAVDYTLYGTSVYVVEPCQGQPADSTQKCTFRKSIQVGRKFQNSVEVLKGLDAHATVVSAGQIKLFDGAVVSINNAVHLEAQPSYTH